MKDIVFNVSDNAGEATRTQAAPDIQGVPANAYANVVQVGLEEAKPVGKQGLYEVSENEVKLAELMALIMTKIDDPNFPLAEVNRHIAMCMMLITGEVMKIRKDPSQHNATVLLKSYADHMKNMQMVEKSLTSTDMLRSRDILNFDGPKFRFVFNTIVDWVKEAATDALGKSGDTQAKSIMSHFRDIVATREDDLRKQTDKIVGGSEATQ